VNARIVHRLGNRIGAKKRGGPGGRPSRNFSSKYPDCFLGYFVCLHLCTELALSVGPPVKAVVSLVAHFFFLQRAIT
jgi:hypothetical protein